MKTFAYYYRWERPTDIYQIKNNLPSMLAGKFYFNTSNTSNLRYEVTRWLVEHKYLPYAKKFERLCLDRYWRLLKKTHRLIEL